MIINLVDMTLMKPLHTMQMYTDYCNYYYLQKHGLIPLCFLISGHYQEESCPDGTPQ